MLLEALLSTYFLTAHPPFKKDAAPGTGVQINRTIDPPGGDRRIKTYSSDKRLNSAPPRDYSKSLHDANGQRVRAGSDPR